MNALTPLAVQNIDVLQALRTPPATAAALATQVGRDKSNLHKTLKGLEAAQLVARSAAGAVPSLTPLGAAALEAWDRANSPREPAEDDRAKGRVIFLRHSQIKPDPANVRREFDQAELKALAASIRALGMKHRPSVRREPDADGRHQLTMGERRWRAWGMLIADGGADLDLPCWIDDAGPAEIAEGSLVENLQRVDLNHVEIAEGFERLATEHGRSNRDIAERCGRTIEYVQQHRRLLKLPAEVLDLIRRGELSLHEGLKLIAEPKAPAEPPTAAADVDHQHLNPDGANGDRPTLPTIAETALAPGSARTYGGAGISLTVGQQYVLSELAYKAGIDRARFGGMAKDKDCAWIRADAGADRDFAILLRNGHITWGRAPDGRYFACVSDFGLAASSGFAVSYIAVSGYRTPWLREQPTSADPLVVNGVRFPNAVRAAEARRLAAGGGPSNHGGSATSPAPRSSPVAETTGEGDREAVEGAGDTAEPPASDAGLRTFIDDLEARLGSGVEAIKFAVQIDDHYDRLEFLNAWLEGRCFDDWPEFDARVEDCRPADEDLSPALRRLAGGAGAAREIPDTEEVS